MFYSRQAPPVTNHIGHMSLWLWAYCIDPRYDELLIRCLILIVDTAEREELKSFFDEAVIGKNMTLPLAERFCSELLIEKVLNEPLRGVTGFLSAISVHCPPVLHVKTEKSPLTLMQCIRVACQRQLCSGQNNQYANSVLGACLSVIRCVWALTFC